MENNLYYSELFDLYGSLLTDKQQEYFKDYYFENLLLEEIALNDSVSKNAVSKQIKETKKKLDYYEEKLKIYKKKEDIKSEFSKEESILKRLEKYGIF